MPRKQRFKPSRKPKPVPPKEDAVMGQQEGSVVNNDNAPPRETPPLRDVNSVSGVEPG